MCGIAGAVAFRDGARPDRERLCAMAGLMAHRGPDGEGFWADPRGRVALAHRRLSIIDIAGGRQPMCSDDGQIALVFNGEIYNYRELRRSLSDEGVQFHTPSGTGVLLRMYERYGSGKLPAGTLLRVSSSGARSLRYWALDGAVQPFAGRFADAVDRLEDLLTTAVTLRLRSDVPLGLFLSGGIDSSLVAAIAARHCQGEALTFSIGFAEAAFDESGYSERVAQHIGTRHRTFTGRPVMLDILPALVRHCAEPFGDSAALAVWLLARETRKHVTVVLTGDGGDEGFGGYDWYRTALRLKRLRSAVPKGVLRLGATVRSQRPWVKRVKRAVGTLALDEPERFSALRMFGRDDEAQTLYAGDLLQTRRDGGDGVRAWLAPLYPRGNGSAP